MQVNRRNRFMFIISSFSQDPLIEIESGRDFSLVINGNENDMLWSDPSYSLLS